MKKLEQIYEGKAKKVFRTDDPERFIVEYKDDATAFNGQKKGTILGKGSINNRMTNLLMQMLEKHGVPTHFVEELNDRETVVKKVEIVPLEVIIRNISAGHFASNYGVEEGIVFEHPTIEFSYKNDDLGDPLINSYHALALKLATKEEIDTIIRLSFKVDEVLQEFFLTVGIKLVDFKLEFGRTSDGTIILADEISPTPAACGIRTPTRSWIRTASVGIWGTWRMPIRRSWAACWQSLRKNKEDTPMCGIVGFTGSQNAAPILLDGLKKLEYRGYDSAGIAVLGENGIHMVKASGMIKNLDAKIKGGAALPGHAGIGHTRWATHGEPTDVNAHPHMSNDNKFAVVHNGIIENYAQLREELKGKGFQFKSETDTEVIVHLMDMYYEGDLKKAVLKTISRLEGAYALGILCSEEGGRIVAARQSAL